MEKQLASLLFPEALVDFFIVKSVDKNRTHYIFRLDEKHIFSEGYASIDIKSKGFYNEESIIYYFDFLGLQLPTFSRVNSILNLPFCVHVSLTVYEGK